MSSSYNTENALREEAKTLYSLAYDLEQAADILRDMRESEGIKERVKDLKERAKDWMKDE